MSHIVNRFELKRIASIPQGSYLHDMKYCRVPSELTDTPYYNRALKINGLSVIESCTLTHRSQGTMFLQEHLLLYVRQGQNFVTHGKLSFLIKQNEMLLLKKNT